MLMVCGKGKKGGGMKDTKRRAILKKEETLQEGRREMEKAAYTVNLSKFKLKHMT
jgi:hypothetical protein